MVHFTGELRFRRMAAGLKMCEVLCRCVLLFFVVLERMESVVVVSVVVWIRILFLCDDFMRA